MHLCDTMARGAGISGNSYPRFRITNLFRIVAPKPLGGQYEIFWDTETGIQFRPSDLTTGDAGNSANQRTVFRFRILVSTQ